MAVVVPGTPSLRGPTRADTRINAQAGVPATVVLRSAVPLRFEVTTDPANELVGWEAVRSPHNPAAGGDLPIQLAFAGDGHGAVLGSNLIGLFTVSAVSLADPTNRWTTDVVFVSVDVQVATSVVTPGVSYQNASYLEATEVGASTGNADDDIYGWSAQVDVQLTGSGAGGLGGTNEVELAILQNALQTATFPIVGVYPDGQYQEVAPATFPIIDASVDGEDWPFISGNLITEVTPLGAGVFRVWNQDTPQSVFPLLSPGGVQITAISGQNAFRTAIAARVGGAINQIIVFATIVWRINLAGTIDAAGVYHPDDAARTTSNAAFALVDRQDAAAAQFETFPPLFSVDADDDECPVGDRVGGLCLHWVDIPGPEEIAQ
jgi:hypothetical protein